MSADARTQEDVSAYILEWLSYRIVMKMPHYIVLVKLTEKGGQNIKQGWTKDRPQVKAQVQKMGGKMTGYMTFGPYDFVEFLELPDDKAAARFALMAGATGVVSTVTLKAFSEDEVDKMVQELP